LVTKIVAVENPHCVLEAGRLLLPTQSQASHDHFWRSQRHFLARPTVYPAMVEGAIYEHPDVEEALVIGVPEAYR